MKSVKLYVSIAILLVLCSFWGLRISDGPLKRSKVVKSINPVSFADYYSIANPSLFFGIPVKDCSKLLNSERFERRGFVFSSKELQSRVVVSDVGRIQEIEGPTLFFQGNLNAQKGDDVMNFESGFKPDSVSTQTGLRIATYYFRGCKLEVASRNGKIDHFALRPH